MVIYIHYTCVHTNSRFGVVRIYIHLHINILLARDAQQTLFHSPRPSRCIAARAKTCKSWLCCFEKSAVVITPGAQAVSADQASLPNHLKPLPRFFSFFRGLDFDSLFWVAHFGERAASERARERERESPPHTPSSEVENRPPPSSAAADTMPPTPRLRGPLNQLHSAAHDGSTKRVLAFLSRCTFDINGGDPQCWTPLMHGAYHGSPQVIEALLKGGANVWVVADGGFTALHVASQQGTITAARLLLRAGADLHATASGGYSALHVASGNGHVAVMRVLIEAGANINARLPSTGETPLYTAATKGHVGSIKMLLFAKANALFVTIDSGMKATPLDVAAHYGHANVVRELLQQLGIKGCGGHHAGRNAFTANINGRCSPRIAQLLVDAGMDTATPIRIALAPGGRVYEDALLLDHANRRLRENNIGGRDATQEQLTGLEGIRRLLMRVEAVHAVSWLWSADSASTARAARAARKCKTPSPSVVNTLPILRRRAAKPGLLLRPMFR